MPSAGRIKISIRDDETNTFLEEYQIVTAGPNTECWIESKEKSRFSIQVSVTPPDGKDLYAFRITVFVDGQRVERGLFGQIDKTFYHSYCYPGVRDIGNVLKPFTFAKTRFMEDGQIEKSLLNDLGTIQVRVQRVMITGKSKNQSFTPYYKSESKSVNEKAKKALITHSVEYAAPVTHSKQSVHWDATSIDTDNAPLHMFTLKYQILEALDVIPSAHVPHNELEDSASATPSSDDEEEDTADPAEKIKRLKDKLRQLKRKVKEEPRASPELVDLTQPEMKKRKIVVDLTRVRIL